MSIMIYLKREFHYKNGIKIILPNHREDGCNFLMNILVSRKD